MVWAIIGLVWLGSAALSELSKPESQKKLLIY
jgi:hypothetical protein